MPLEKENFIISSRIVEMVSSSSINIDVDPKINITELTKDDEDPMFVIVEVIRAGLSGNNRRYSNPIIQSIASMIPGVQGFLGHKDPTKSSFEFREPQCIYVGSKVEEIGNGKLRTLGKCYIFRSSLLREWIPKSIAAGNPLTVSVYGSGDVMRSTDGILDVVKMNVLESIDWANPGTQGVSTSQALNIVSEMLDEKGGTQMDRQEIISSVAISELKAFNPNVVSQLIGGATIAELKENNPKLYDEIVKSAQISEMNLKIDGNEKSVKISEIQSIIDSKDKTIAEMKENADKKDLEVFKSSKIAELVDEAFRDKIAGRVTGSTKEEIEASIKSEVTYIQEMLGDNNSNQPRGNKAKASTDELKNDVISLFNPNKSTK